MSAVRVVSSTCASGMIATLEIELVAGVTKSVDMVGERQVLRGDGLGDLRRISAGRDPFAGVRPEAVVSNLLCFYSTFTKNK